MGVFLTVIECLGVVAFSISGTIVAIRKNTDVVGALIFALLTAFGGGIMRDLILGINPPNVLANEEYFVLATVCIVSCLACFFASFNKSLNEFINKHRHDVILDMADAVGLAVFTVFGVEIAASVVGTDNKILLIFCGCISGVGGGVLRDICTAQIPILFRKHVYLLPALIGATVFSLAHGRNEHFSTAHVLFMLLSIAIIIILRFFAIKFKWNLPTPKKEAEVEKE